MQAVVALCNKIEQTSLEMFDWFDRKSYCINVKHHVKSINKLHVLADLFWKASSEMFDLFVWNIVLCDITCISVLIIKYWTVFNSVKQASLHPDEVYNFGLFECVR